MPQSTGMVVGIVGAGAMGSGIAQVAAAAGHHVILGDMDLHAVPRALASIAKTIARDAEKGRLDRNAADALLARISDAGALGDGHDAYRRCDIVIEAIAEWLPHKVALFASLEQTVGAACILGTNTSSLSVAAIAGGCRHPERVIGIHFFNPAQVMPLVELVPGIATDADVVAQVRTLVTSWNKRTVISTDTPGFIVNRVARPFYGESLRLMEEGFADAPTIDWAMRELGGFRMGPFELMDFIGNDINFAVTKSVFDGFFQDPRYRPALTQQRMVEAGMLGRKCDRGYYDYRAGAQRPEPSRDNAVGRAILDRVLAMLVNEAVEAVFMRVASAPDIETAMTKGVNYPKGLLAWGDEIGPSVILGRLDALHSEYGDDRYRASSLLRRRVRESQSLLA